MLAESSSLLQRSNEAPFAWLTNTLNGQPDLDQGVAISNTQFLAHVCLLADQLPEMAHAINVCDNRYLFAVAVCAVILRQQTNLLPPNKNAATQAQLHERYPDSYIVCDRVAELPAGIQAINLNDIDWSAATAKVDMPTVPLDHLAVISFTSGSTGESKPNIKSWRTLQASSAINAAYMLPNQHDTFYHLATVPGQHMWGFETSVLLPLFSNVCLVDARPMYPHDILDVLRKLPAPRTLISTPLHLRALTATQENSDEALPDVANILCATAPLDQALALNIEACFATQLREVYGCSEVGSMAVRRTAHDDVWTQFSGLDFSQTSEGDTVVSAAYLPDKVVLQDTLEYIGTHQFRLAGRQSDQIKIAGKRGSLHEVNSVLNRFSGLLDGVVFFPSQTRLVPRLVAIVCLADGVTKTQLREHFRVYLDAAFIPRPIYVVDSLPREENGKLPKVKLQAYYEALSSGH